MQKLYWYNTLITHFAGSERKNLKKGEHGVFLFYWYNKYIFCAKSNKCLVKNMPVAEALVSGHLLALSPAILVNFTRCLVKATLRKINPHQNGPLWAFQLWLQVYFPSLRREIPNFSPSESMGLELASRLIFTHSAEDIFRYFFDLEDLSNNEFQIWYRRTYLSSIILPQSTWEAANDTDLRES